MNPIFKIIYFTRHLKKWYFVMAAFVVSISLLSLVIPLLSKEVVDIIVNKLQGREFDFNYFILLLVAIVVIDVFISLLTAIGQWIGDILAVRLQTFLSRKFYEHLLHLDIGFYDNAITGQIVNKMYRGISSITDFIQNMLNNFLPFFLTAAVTILLLARYSLVISVLLAVLFPLYILISHSSTQAWQKYEQKKNAINDLSQGRVFESISGIRIVKAFTAQINELTSFLQSRHQIENLAIAQTKEWHAYDFVRRFSLNVILFAIYAYVVYWTFIGRFTLGEMTLLLQLVNQARFPLFAMSFILGQIQQASAGSADFFKVLETKTKVIDQPDATELQIPQKLKPTEPLVHFEKVSFEYEAGKHVLHDITFNIYPNEKFALVGESGQGKSTIVNLLLRYYQPQKGKILIHDQDISQVTQHSLHDHIAVVFQESLLFSGTLMENIRYGRADATDEEVIKAAKAANAHEFIQKLPNKYHSLIGERGVKLSGGQKQRIAIARAILKDAPIIILDEATSSLDSKSEVLVQKGLQRLLENKTAIIIAHRLSTIANADHILVIAEGKIAQYGSGAELIKNKNGLYAQLVKLQQQVLKGSAKDTPEHPTLKKFDLVG